MELTDKVIKELGVVIEDMHNREVDIYWYGQFTAALDQAGADIHEFITNGKVVPFVSEE